MVNPQCSQCPVAYCESTPAAKLDRDALPRKCPLKTSPEIGRQSVEWYKEDAVRRLYIPATITEKEAYQRVRGVVMAVRPRIKELIEFAKLLQTKKIGIAFCAGLRDEATRLARLLENQGFEEVSVVCKCGAVDKTEVGIPPENKIRNPEKFEAACNPLLQAELLNQAQTSINVIIGLCVGHDMLFTMHSAAPVTTLIVKDRLTGHNPVITLYSRYHKDIV